MWENFTAQFVLVIFIAVLFVYCTIFSSNSARYFCFSRHCIFVTLNRGPSEQWKAIRRAVLFNHRHSAHAALSAPCVHPQSVAWKVYNSKELTSDVKDILTSRCSLSSAGDAADSKLLLRAVMVCRLKPALIKQLLAPPHPECCALSDVSCQHREAEVESLEGEMWNSIKQVSNRPTPSRTAL